MQEPSIGRIVWYRSRTGKYSLPAMITATQETLDPDGVKLYSDTHGKMGVPALSSPDHVHLLVLTPGVESDQALPDVSKSRNRGGTYQEWNVELWEPSGPSMEELSKPQAGSRPPEEQPGGTWIWPVIR